MTTLDDRITELIEAAEAVAEVPGIGRIGEPLNRLVEAVAHYRVARKVADRQLAADADARARLDRDEGGLLASDGALWDFSTGGTP